MLSIYLNTTQFYNPYCSTQNSNRTNMTLSVISTILACLVVWVDHDRYAGQHFGAGRRLFDGIKKCMAAYITLTQLGPW